MSDKQDTFNVIKEKYMTNKTISEVDMQRLEVILQTPGLDVNLRNEIVDFVSDVFLEQDDYQSAHDIVNQTVKRSKLDTVYLLYTKLIYVRLEAMLYGKNITVKTTNKVQDDYKKLKRNAIIIIRDFEKMFKSLDVTQTQRIQMFFSKMMYAMETIEGKPITEIKRDVGKIVHFSDEVTITEEDVLPVQESVGEDNVESVAIEESSTEERGDTMEEVENIFDELTGINGKISTIEDLLIDQTDDTPDYLDTILQLIELKYSKLDFLNRRIAKLRTDIQRYEEISQTRKSALELVGGETGINNIIDSRNVEVEALVQEQQSTLQEFENDTKKVKDIFERG